MCCCCLLPVFNPIFMSYILICVLQLLCPIRFLILWLPLTYMRYLFLLGVKIRTMKMSSCRPLYLLHFWILVAPPQRSCLCVLLSLLCPFLQFSKQPWSLASVLFLLTFALSVTSLPADIEKGRRKVVHVLGKDGLFSTVLYLQLKSQELWGI